MRARRSIVAGFVVGTLLALPHQAAADGGAYLDFGATHYLPGQTARGVGYVSIPANKQDLLDRGPFFVYVLPPGAWIEPGKPVPPDAIQVGTATIAQENKTVFEVRASFAVPDVTGDYYQVQLCNSPCTIAGFSEPLTATISIVQTVREGELLDEYQKLYGKNWSLRRQSKKAAKANDELTAELTASRETVATLSADVERLQAEVAAAPLATVTPPSEEGRPIVDPWALVAIVGALIVGLVAIALGLGFGRRSAGRRSPVVPPTSDVELRIPAQRARAPVH